MADNEHKWYDDHDEEHEHGDRALSVIGDDRVIVTEDDVCFLLRETR